MGVCGEIGARLLSPCQYGLGEAGGLAVFIKEELAVGVPTANGLQMFAVLLPNAPGKRSTQFLKEGFDDRVRVRFFGGGEQPG